MELVQSLVLVVDPADFGLEGLNKIYEIVGEVDVA